MFEDHHGDLTSMVRALQLELACNRLNPHRVKQWLSELNPDYFKMMELATTGMTVFKADDFIANVGNGCIPPLRTTYRQIAPAVHRLLSESTLEKGLAFLLPKELALSVPGVHLSLNSWAPKQGKPKGRPIGDCSDAGPRQTALNSKSAKILSDEHWGVIHHPTLVELARQILDCFDQAQQDDPAARWEDLSLFKMDLAGAYTLLSFRPEDVHLLAFEFINDVVLFYTCGIFGWTGTPAAFQVVTRACIFELTRMIRGRLKMYTDDILGVCMRTDLCDNLAKAEQFLCGLLGPTAVEPKKTEVGRTLVQIGYVFDLDTRRVSISERNLSKALVGFLRAAPQGRASRVEMERLGSWASRYGNINVFIRAFTRPLYESYKGQGKRNSKDFPLKPVALRAIRVIRMLLVMTVVEPLAFSRTLDSFRERAHTVVIEFDASLSGLGLVWYAVSNDGIECPIGAASLSTHCLAFGEDSQFQNCAEFIAATFGILGLSALGLMGASVWIRGDSTSALCWSETTRFKGTLTSNASVVFTVLMTQLDTTVVGSTFISSKENVRTDMLSRGSSVAQLRVAFADMRAVPEVLWPVTLSAQVLKDCDPRRVIETDTELGDLWQRVQQYHEHPDVVVVSPGL